MPIVDCRICSRGFFAKPSNLKRGWGVYCSISCARKGKKTGKTVPCQICGRSIYRAPEKLARAKSKKYFCSKSCQAIWKNSRRLGEDHPNWKHGKYAYKSILHRNKVAKLCGLCGTRDRRILAVHHIDHDHSNNKLSNLAWLCHNCHHLVHHVTVERQRFLESRRREH
jgi:endogenous inhibitor of DNA gyrase (YacG/DUF329 family)